MWLNGEYTPPSLCNLFGIDDAALAIGGSAIANIAGGLFTNQANARQQQLSAWDNYMLQLQSQQYNTGQTQVAMDYNRDEAEKARQWSQAMQGSQAWYNLQAMGQQGGINKALQEDAARLNMESQARQQNYEQQFLNQTMSFNSDQAQRQMAFQANQSQTQRDFEAWASSSAYQRAVKDLRAAGLNPILGVSGGASTPTVGAASGAAGSVGAPSVGAPSAPGASVGLGSVGLPSAPSASVSGARSALASTQPARMENFLGPAVTSALQALRTMTDVQVAGADIANKQSQTQLNVSGAALNNATADKTAAEAELSRGRTGMLPTERRQREQETATSGSQLQLNQAAAGNAAAMALLAKQQAATAKAVEDQTRNVTDMTKTYGPTGYGTLGQPVVSGLQAIRNIWNAVTQSAAGRYGGSRPAIDVSSQPNAIPQ